jgi:hypothetical protein
MLMAWKISWRGREPTILIFSSLLWGVWLVLPIFASNGQIRPAWVYWGANPKYLMKDLAQVIGFKETIIEVLEGKKKKFISPKSNISLIQIQY